jgi:hypothetical protein
MPSFHLHPYVQRVKPMGNYIKASGEDEFPGLPFLFLHGKRPLLCKHCCKNRPSVMLLKLYAICVPLHHTHEVVAGDPIIAFIDTSTSGGLSNVLETKKPPVPKDRRL